MTLSVLVDRASTAEEILNRIPSDVMAIELDGLGMTLIRNEFLRKFRPGETFVHTSGVEISPGLGCYVSNKMHETATELFFKTCESSIGAAFGWRCFGVVGFSPEAVLVELERGRNKRLVRFTTLK